MVENPFFPWLIYEKIVRIIRRAVRIRQFFLIHWYQQMKEKALINLRPVLNGDALTRVHCIAFV
jgi:hypothetical protein